MFTIKWGDHFIGSGGLGSSRPYTLELDQAKTWRTRRGAERYLELKDPQWAAACTIVEVGL